MKDNRIADNQITASSEFHDGLVTYPYHGAKNARLNRLAQQGTTGAWSAELGDLNPWIQVDLLTSKWVSGVKIQGRQDVYQWVTKYNVEYSSDGQTWMYVQSKGDQGGVVSGTQTEKKYQIATEDH